MSYGTEEWYKETARRIIEMTNALQYDNAYALLRISWIAEDGQVPNAFLDATFDANQAFHGGPEVKRGKKMVREYNHDLFMKAIATLEEYIKEPPPPYPPEVEDFLKRLDTSDHWGEDLYYYLRSKIDRILEGQHDWDSVSPSDEVAIVWFRENHNDEGFEKVHKALIDFVGEDDYKRSSERVHSSWGEP